MKTFSRRKFVETAVMSGVGVTVLSDIAKNQDNVNDRENVNSESGSTGSHPSDNNLIEENNRIQDSLPHDFNTMRPVRKMRNITVTVGQAEGDLQGRDDKVLQAAIDYVSNLGGGTVHILPGIYTMHNSLFPRQGITIRGSGDKTILSKSPSVSSKIVREADWFEYCVKVEDIKGFTVGCGLALSRDDKDPQKVSLFTATAIQDNIIFLDKRTEENYWMMEGARASTRFSIINGLNVDDVKIEDLILDGNRSENEHVNDNYVGAVFMQYCNRWSFRNVIARNYNSDGFSFQVCDDIHFEDCSAINNADLGFHPGSGSQRPLFRRCTSRGNSQGFFWCWGACDGIAEECMAAENLKYGVNFGHRDTDNILRNCVIERNGEIGVLFRKEVNEYRTGDRNLLENCVIRDNGKAGPGLGIDIQWKTNDITIRNCRFENTKDGPQKVGVRISSEAQRIILENNKFTGSKVDVEDLGKKDKI
jgi:hypothetical protein